MKYIYYILSILFTLSFGSCKDDIPGSDNPNIGGITLTLTSGNMETRTNLTSTAATQNVETVYIALYKGNDDKATFVDAQDFGWSKIETTNPYIKQNTFTFDNLVAGAEYILLAVGLDTESKETYGFNDINSFESKLKGKTLANAKAIAANAASIATSELFAGWNTFTYEPDIENKVEVEMKRRVAGVLCYLKDIPSTITTSDGTYTVTKVQLRLFTNQNSAIRLARKEKGENNIGLQEDFGDKPLEGSDILMSYNLKGLPSKDGFYKIPVTDNTRLQNTILMGAYMLPIKYSSAENKSTLTLEVLGKKQSDTGDTTEEEETKLQSFPVLQNGLSSGNDAEKYSIYPNYIYHIGQKPDNNSIEGDYPESLAGEKITVTAKEWDNEEVNVEFPSVPVNATMELVNEDGMAYNTDRYIFDCIGIDDVDGYGYTAESPSYPLYYPTPERLILRISPSLLKSKWRVTIYKCDEDGNIGSNPSGGEMLYINKNNSYEQEYEATPEECEDGTSLTLLLTDYADGNYSSQKKRYSKILLETLDKDRNTVATDDMVIAQYNAITVNYEDRILGFSYYDWGVKRDLGTGDIMVMGEKAVWNYAGAITSSTSVFGKTAGFTQDNGLENYDDAKAQLKYEGMYNAFYNGLSGNGSALYKAAKKILKISGSSKSESSGVWYLPAYYEFETFLKQINGGFNITKERYWTSSIPRLNEYRSLTIFYKSNGSIDYENADRENSYYMRQVCLIKGN